MKPGELVSPQANFSPCFSLLQRNDIAMAITKFDQFDFLIDIVPRDELKPPKRQVSWEGRRAPRTLVSYTLLSSLSSSHLLFLFLSFSRPDPSLTSPSVTHLWVLLTQCLGGGISVKVNKMRIKDKLQTVK